MSSVFDVVTDPRRRLILDLLRRREHTVGDLVREVRASQPAISKHLRVLREAGLVACRVEGQHRVYRIEPEPLRALDAWIAPYRTLWGSRLDALEHHLDVMEEES